MMIKKRPKLNDTHAEARSTRRKKLLLLNPSASPREYSDIPGFCPSATTAAITAHLNAGSRGAAKNAEKKKTSASESLRVSAPPREYSDIPGFCPSAVTAEIAAH